MATENLGKVSLTMGGSYSPTASYARLTVVRGSNGNSYVSKTSVAGVEPGVDPGWEDYWQILALDGTQGGDDVSWEQTVTTGTKIAAITINGTETEVYAPEGGGGGTITDVQVNGQSVVTDGVANVPIGTNSQLGVFKVSTLYGITVRSDGTLQPKAANVSTIKSGVDICDSIVSSNAYAATFYGLAKAAGDATQSASSNAVGTYTEEAKAAIRTMLGVTGESGVNIVSLTGTVIDQTGAANTMYVCGEVTSLTFAAPATGICAIRFTSGSTATVATFTGVTSWMFGFDPTTLEANKLYEINILNGVGCAGWA